VIAVKSCCIQFLSGKRFSVFQLEKIDEMCPRSERFDGLLAAWGAMAVDFFRLMKRFIAGLLLSSYARQHSQFPCSRHKKT
jgi:hypothetical protein